MPSKRTLGKGVGIVLARHPAVTTSVRGKAKRGKAVSETHVTPETSTPVYAPPKPPKFKKRLGESQDTNTFKKQKKRHEKNAHKRATVFF